MNIVSDIAIVVGLVRDVVFLLLLFVALIALLVIFNKMRGLVNKLNETAETVQEAVQTVSEKVVEPAASNAGAMRGIGGLFGFLMGMRRRGSENDK